MKPFEALMMSLPTKNKLLGNNGDATLMALWHVKRTGCDKIIQML